MRMLPLLFFRLLAHADLSQLLREEQLQVPGIRLGIFSGHSKVSKAILGTGLDGDSYRVSLRILINTAGV